MADPIAIAGRAIAALESLEVPYAVGGSFASSIHGIARATADIDLIADLAAPQAESFVRAVEGEFYVSERFVRDAIDRRSSFNLVHLTELVKIDVFLPLRTPLGARQLARRRLEVVAESPEQRAYVLSPEDVVLQKLAWLRLGGGVSERQWRDVLGVLKVQSGKLDLEDLRAAAAQEGLLESLERALEDAERAPLR